MKKPFKYLKRWSALEIKIIPYILKVKTIGGKKSLQISLTFCIHLQ